MGLEDVSKYPVLFGGLLASGSWSLDDLKKLAGLNFLRVLREVEKVRKKKTTSKQKQSKERAFKEGRKEKLPIMKLK